MIEIMLVLNLVSNKGGEKLAILDPPSHVT
jgi:hypothetical protein